MPNDSLHPIGPPYEIRRGLMVRRQIEARQGVSLAYGEYKEDFFPAAGATLPAPLATAKTGANAADGAYLSNAPGGQYRLSTTDNNEAQTNRLDFGDHRAFDIDKVLLFEARVRLIMDGLGGSAALGVGDEFVCGLAGAHNAALDSNTLHAWFRMIGDAEGDLDLLWETDDGTTDDDDNDTNVDVVNTQWLWLMMVFDQETSSVFFYADPGNNDIPNYKDNPVGVGSLAAATGNVQPYLFLSKAAAANNNHTLDIDCWRVVFAR